MRFWPCLLLLLSGPLVAQSEPEEFGVVDEPSVSVEEPALSEEDVPDDTRRIYRTYDERGNPVFTDTPADPQQAKEVELRKPSILPMGGLPSLEAGPLEGDGPVPLEVYRVRISEPADRQTFQNPTEPVSVKVNVAPALQEGDRVQVVANGVPLKGSLATGFVLEDPVRGEYRLEAQVIDGRKVEARSPVTTIYVHRPSVLLPPRDPDPRTYGRNPTPPR